MATTMLEPVATSRFRDDEFVDAIAAQPGSASSPLLAVALSALESNLWGGGVAVLDGASGERICGSQVKAGVSALAWTGDARDLLAFGCDNGDVVVTRLTTGEDGDRVLVPVVNPGGAGHDDVVTGVAASAIETTVFATSSWDLTIKLWDVTAMDKTLTTLDGHADLIWDIVMSPSEAHVLATASQDATVQLWDDRDVVQGAHSTLSTRSHAALALDWHPTQTHLIAVGLESGDVLTFDTRATKSPLATLSAHEGAVHRVKYSPTASDLLAVGSDDATVSLITNSSSLNALVQPFSLGSSTGPEHKDYVRALEWYALPSGSADADAATRTVLATGSWDHSLRSWSLSGL